MQGLCSISAHLWALEKAGVRQPKAAAQNEPRSRPKLHQGPHCGEASMRHQVDIFQQQLQYETLAAAATPLMLQAAATATLMLASHLQCDGWATPQSLKLLTPEDVVQMNILPGHRRLVVA